MVMLLEEYLEELPPGCPVKVGAKDGSSYIYTGVVDDLDLAELNFNCETAARNAYLAIKKRYKDELCRLKPKLKKLLMEQIKQTDGGKLIVKRGAAKTTDAKALASVGRAYNLLIDCKYRLDAYTPLASREVLEVFRGYECGHPTVIMISGFEVGKYWLISEAGGADPDEQGEFDEWDEGNEGPL